MPPARIEFHPRAVAEARAARRWYAYRNQAVAGRFLLALDIAMEQIRSGPQQWPTYLQGTRAYKLRRFPYLVVFVESPSGIQVIAVAHTSRRPGYWRKRTA